MANLTEAAEAEFRVTYTKAADRMPGKIRAAYVTTEDSQPGMLAFKDHRHRTVMLANRDLVVSVERIEETGGCADSGTRMASGRVDPPVGYWTGPGCWGVALTAVQCPECKQRVTVDYPVKTLIEAKVFEKAFEQIIEDAAAQAKRECPDHDVIRMGQ